MVGFAVWRRLAVGGSVLHGPAVHERGLDLLPVGVGGIVVILVHRGDDGFTVGVDVGLEVGDPRHDVVALGGIGVGVACL